MSDPRELVNQAAALLREGKVVAFPTETVYGLGADATNADAVARIFAIKGRPATNPLIVHVASAEAAKACAHDWPETADLLASVFWPGPLTLVLPKAEPIVRAVTAGGPTVGLRVPDHPLALDLLERFGGGVAAPSANRSNHVSPTMAAHVREDLGDAVDLILNGGPSRVGIESTVLSLAGEVPTVLRLGGVSVEDLRRTIGRVAVRGGSDVGTAHSPGRQEIHYSPSIPAFRADGEWPLLRRDDAVLSLGMPVPENRIARVLPATPRAVEAALYATLRELEASGAKRIFVQMPPEGSEWDAVRDRLMRATRGL